MISLGGIELHLYGLLIGVGVWLAWEISLRTAPRLGVEKKIIDQALWWVLIPGVIGARVYHVIYLWEFYKQEPAMIFKIWEGGVGIWGAIAGGVAGLAAYWFFKARKRIKFLRLLDTAAVGVPLAQAVGRWGNLANSELWGRATSLPWGIKRGEIRVHPLFLYESLLNLVLFATLWWLVRKSGWLKNGNLAGIYLIGYGVIRFLLEPLRPEGMIWRTEGIPLAQLWAAGAAVTGGLLLLNGHLHDLV